MAGEESLIDQALAASEATGPPTLLEVPPPETPAEQVYVIYRAKLDKRRGLRGSGDAKIERFVRAATRAGIPEHEIDAAIARAEAEEI
jgi:hypothetical protein